MRATSSWACSTRCQSCRMSRCVRSRGRLATNQRIWDFSDNQAAFARKYVINRWRLRRRTRPPRCRSRRSRSFTGSTRTFRSNIADTVKAGVLEWNKAFEKIGFKDAIRVEQQPDDATWSTHETGRASVRWFVDYNDGALAVGPSRVDPRTGEILDADITMGNGWVTLPRRRVEVQYPRPMPAANADGGEAVATWLPSGAACTQPRVCRAICGSDDAAFELCSTVNRRLPRPASRWICWRCVAAKRWTERGRAHRARHAERRDHA